MGIRRAGLALCVFLLASTGYAQREVAERRYTFSGDDALVVRVPTGWQERVGKGGTKAPTLISYRPKAGAPFEVLLTPVRARGANLPLEQMQPAVLALADAARKQAVEERLTLVELLGPQARGYYFKATDRAPKPGAYKYLAQGMLALGDVRVAFTVLTNEGQGAVVDAAFDLLRNARFAGPAAQPAAIAGRPPRPEAGKLQALLSAGNFAELDRELSAYQDAYRSGVIGDDEAARAFTALVTTDAELKDAYDKWVAQMPRSYVARIARGYFLSRLGYQARGTQYASKTSQAQFKEMRELFKIATEDLEASLRLDAKPVLGYGTMISISQAAGGGTPAARLLDHAIAIDPRVYTARASYLASLRPEWGGSVERMQAALDSWKGSLDRAQLERLGLMVEDAKWQTALEPAALLVNAKRYKEAIAEYDRALAQKPVARAFSMRGYSHAQLGEHAKAIPDYDRALEIDPEGACCSGTYAARGRSYLATGELHKGINDLVIAAEADDKWAARELASIYAFGKHGFKRDYLLGRRWCEVSAKQGDGLAMYCLGSLYHAGLGVPKDAARAGKWFEGAAKRGIADAQADLAYMLWHGQGIPQDRDQAIKWWRAAVKLGNKRAERQLDANVTGWERFTKVTIPEWWEAK
jgi:TPR repeat protein